MNSGTPKSGRISLPLALISVVCFWAALYLPCLGTLPFKNEEGRRTLPAMAMIETGNWIVPSVGGEAYFRKPPLFNWCIALAIQLTGQVNEWSARLPSAVATLLLALGLFEFTRRWLGTMLALTAVVMLLVNATMLEKGRQAELEGIMIATYGLAFLAWVHGELHGERFKHWLLSGLFLGPALLTKGPLPTLVFFYLLVGFRLGSTGRMRELLSSGHIGCLVLTWLPFIVWAVLMFRQAEAEAVSKVWATELSGRVAPGIFSFTRYVASLAKAVANLLPWVACAPLLWQAALLARMPEAQRLLFIAIRRGTVLGFLVVAGLPGARPRYTAQLIVPLVLLVSWAMAYTTVPAWWLTVWRRILQALTIGAVAAALAAAIWWRNEMGFWLLAPAIVAGAWCMWQRLRESANPPQLGCATGIMTLLVAAVLWSVLSRVGPAFPSRYQVGAREILSLLPDGQRLVAVRPGWERVLPHLGFRVRYVADWRQLPPDRPLFVMVNQEADRLALQAEPGAKPLPLAARPADSYYEIWRLDAPDVRQPTAP